MDSLVAPSLVYKRTSWVNDQTWEVAGVVATELNLSAEDRHDFFLRLGLIEARSGELNLRELGARRRRAIVLRQTSRSALTTCH